MSASYRSHCTPEIKTMSKIEINAPSGINLTANILPCVFKNWRSCFCVVPNEISWAYIGMEFTMEI